jgi:hypothetical protein
MGFLPEALNAMEDKWGGLVQSTTLAVDFRLA